MIQAGPERTETIPQRPSILTRQRLKVIKCTLLFFLSPLQLEAHAQPAVRILVYPLNECMAVYAEYIFMSNLPACSFKISPQPVPLELAVARRQLAWRWHIPNGPTKVRSTYIYQCQLELSSS